MPVTTSASAIASTAAFRRAESAPALPQPWWGAADGAAASRTTSGTSPLAPSWMLPAASAAPAPVFAATAAASDTLAASQPISMSAPARVPLAAASSAADLDADLSFAKLSLLSGSGDWSDALRAARQACPPDALAGDGAAPPGGAAAGPALDALTADLMAAAELGSAEALREAWSGLRASVPRLGSAFVHAFLRRWHQAGGCPGEAELLLRDCWAAGMQPDCRSLYLLGAIRDRFEQLSGGLGM